MKHATKFIALAMVAIMLMSSMIMGSASATLTVKKQVDTPNGATYYNYDVYGSSAKNTADVNVIKFNGKDGLFALPYATEAGRSNYLLQHVEAAQAEGYTVVGAINASFFDMTTYDPNHKLISDGKIVFDQAEYPGDPITAFFEDGSNQLVNQIDIDYALTLGSNTISTKAIGLVNKRYKLPVQWSQQRTGVDITNRFHYYDSDMGTLADGTTPAGYEILCKKLDGTEISIGKTLKGQVISVTEGYHGKTKVTAKDQFVLFVKSDSSYASYAKALKAGDSVSLTPTCTDAGVNAVMSKAVGGISDTYWLVKDGVDYTDTQTSIVHQTYNYARAWTAFGWDEEGSYYFFVSEEGGIDLRDVADAMMEMGCIDVIRVDGGGSTTMWVEGQGIVEEAGPRKVADCILIVKRDYTAEFVPSETGPDGGEKLDIKNNVALGKPYTASELYRQGGADVQWGWDASKDIAYPDENGKSLTDGYVAAFGDYQNMSWAGFHADAPDAKAKGYSWITVDLEGEYDVTELIVYGPCNTGLTGGVGTLGGVKFYDENGKELGTAKASAYNSVTNAFTLTGNFHVSKVEARITGAGWRFVSEVAVVGAECDGVHDWSEESDPGTSSEPEDPSKPDDSSKPEDPSKSESSDPEVSNPDNEPDFVLGDVNKNGGIDMTDYILVKRAYFGTVTLDDEQFKRADVNKNGDIDMTDYIMVKRAYFGTVTLGK